MVRIRGQRTAVSSALDRAGFAIISTAMRQCVTDDDQTSGEPVAGQRPKLTVDELEKAFLALA